MRHALSPGFSAATIFPCHWSISTPEAAATACILTVPMKTRAANLLCPICLGFRRFASLLIAARVVPATHRGWPDTLNSKRARDSADQMEDALEPHAAFSAIQRQLVGAYFLNEYSFEASALFNPSIVAHPDQTGAPAGGRRFILSLRAVGEGHVSSLTFRSGLITADGSVTIDPTARLASIPIVGNRIPGPDGDEVEVIFKPDGHISERVIFPVTESQSN